MQTSVYQHYVKLDKYKCYLLSGAHQFHTTTSCGLKFSKTHKHRPLNLGDIKITKAESQVNCSYAIDCVTGMMTERKISLAQWPKARALQPDSTGVDPGSATSQQCDLGKLFKHVKWRN